MQIEIQQTTTKEVEITLPHYRKNSCFAYKVFSEDGCIIISHSKYSDPAIELRHARAAFQFDDAIECTREEFEALFLDVQQSLWDKAFNNEAEIISKTEILS